MNPPNARYFARSDSAQTTGEIQIHTTIGTYWEGKTGKEIVDDLTALGPVKRLDVYINSPGGDIHDGIAVFNALLRHPARKRVFIDGVAASAASVVAMAGDEIHTAASALWMIHDPWAMVSGNAADMRKAGDMLDKIRNNILQIYQKRTRQNPIQISDWMSAETWMNAEEAKQRGFTDSIIDIGARAALVQPAFSLLDKYQKTPEPLRAKARSTDTRLAEADAYLLRLNRSIAERNNAGARPASSAIGPP